MTQEPSFTEKVTEIVVAEVNALLQTELEANRKAIKSLKGRLTRVANRVDDINILGLQEQLDSLTTQVKALRQDLLTARRNFASTAIMNYTTSLQVGFATSGAPNAKAMLEYLIGLSDSAHKRIQETNDPERVTKDIYDSIIERMKQLTRK